MNYQRLIRLRDDLLNHTNWPEGFVWEWDMCPKCAMGLLARQENRSAVANIEYALAQTANILDIGTSDARHLFYSAFFQNPKIQSYAAITPKNQADVITEWLEKK